MMAFQNHVQAFASETGVFGLNMFYRRRTTLEIVFWCTFVVIFSCYTTKSLVTICKKFLDEEVITMVQRERVDRFVFPAPQICFAGTPIFDNWSRDTNIQSAIEEYRQTGDLNQTNFLFTADFLHQLILTELSMTSQSFAVLFLQSFTVDSSTSFANFSDFVLRKFCLALRLNVTFQSHASNASQTNIASCRPHTVGFANPAYQHGICVDLGVSKFFFETAYDELLIELNTSVIRSELGLDPRTIVFDLDGGDYLGEDEITDFDSIFDILPNRHRNYFVRLNTVYKILNLRRRHCDDDRARSRTCERRCKSRFFVESHGCWPLVYMYKMGSLIEPDGNRSMEVRRCEVEDYLRFKPSEAPHESCHNSCLLACTSPVFFVTGDTSSYAETTKTSIYVSSHVYAVVEEQLANDFESFLANFGGALGLWLGASFASVVHIPVFILRAIFDGLKTEKKPSGDELDLEMTSEASLEAKCSEMIEAKFAAMAKSTKEESMVHTGFRSEEMTEFSARITALEKMVYDGSSY